MTARGGRQKSSSRTSIALMAKCCKAEGRLTLLQLHDKHCAP